MHVFVADPRRGELNPFDLEGIHSLRYRTFLQRLHWDIPAMGQQERDAFDDFRPVFVIVRDGRRQVVGCCRLLPTTGPYMLVDTFPELLAGRAAPRLDDAWEISRFAVAKEARAGLGFTALPAALIRETARFALANGIREYVFVTTVAFERLLARMGVHLERFGPPRQIGIEKSVAIRVFMDEQTVRATRSDCETDPFLGEQAIKKVT